MIKVVINGILGRMGQALVSKITDLSEFELVGGIDRRLPEEALPYPVKTDPETIIPAADVVIDFSLPEGALAVLQACRKNGTSLVSGTTGFSDREMQLFRDAAADIAIVQAFNFSIGINLMAVLLERVSAVLGQQTDVEITEVHHRHKKDAPSGTAILLAEAVRRGRKDVGEKIPLLYGRQGRDLHRGNEIAVHSLRGGSVVGEHTVHFLGENESLMLTHRAQNRGLFVDGALTAARWVSGQPAGLYSMRDVLGLTCE